MRHAAVAAGRRTSPASPTRAASRVRGGESGRLQQRLADEIGGVAGAELAHRLGAMALERARADVHTQGALLVGATLADQAEHFALALCQRLLARLGREHHACRTCGVPAAAALAVPA